MTTRSPLAAAEPLKVLVVDDSPLYRKVIGDILGEMPGVQVVGTAQNGKLSLHRLQVLQPDLLTLDVEMPEIDGLEVLRAIQAQGLDVGEIMCSTLTRRGSDITVAALELGAFDFITKPDGSSLEANRQALKSFLVPPLQAFASSRSLKKILAAKAPPPDRKDRLRIRLPYVRDRVSTSGGPPR